MIIVYEVRTFGFVINKVEADRITDKSVFIRGRRSARESEWLLYFDTIDEAYDFATKSLESRIQRSIQDIEKSKRRLSEITNELERTCQKP